MTTGSPDRGKGAGCSEEKGQRTGVRRAGEAQLVRPDCAIKLTGKEMHKEIAKCASATAHRQIARIRST